MKQHIPIGTSNFKKLRENKSYFVDKSLLIKDVAEGAEIVLYPRPRRFGKTLNLSMLRYFYDNKEDNRELFNGLLIENDKEIMKKQGKHPVVFITFKDVKERTYENCYEAIKEVLSVLYQEHRYLLDSEILEDERINIFHKILDRSASYIDFSNSLKYLTEYLAKYHKSKPVLLIDEYDMPIQASYVNNYYDDLINFIRNLLSGCLKDNDYLEKAVLTGILRVAKESIFSGLNNIKVLSMISDESNDKFGFTENEIKQCLKDFNLSGKLEEVKNWYDGYNFFDTEIYNPWSIINYLDEKILKPYWVNTSGNDMIRNLLKESNQMVKQDLELLIQGKSIKKQINDNIVYKDVSRNQTSLWNFLLMSGYLRYDNLRRENDYYFADLSIPNSEVGYLFRVEIIANWFDNFDKNYELSDILSYLTNGDFNMFRRTFIHFCQSSFSYFDVSGNEPEKFYHAFVLGLIVTLRNKYTIRSNRESGFGRYDIMLIPKKNEDKGFIFEFKKIDSFEKETMESALKNAKKQIIDKNYAQELLDLEISNIYNVVAVFDKKDVEVEIWKN